MAAGANRMTVDDRPAAMGPTVGAGFARGLLTLAVSRGADGAALAQAAGIDLALLEDTDARVPFPAYVALMKAAKAATGEPALALHFGEAGAIARHSIVGLLGQASETMIEAFAALNRFVRLVVETDNEGGGERFRLTRDRRGVWLTDMRLDPNAFHELTESAFAQLVAAPRQYADAPRLKAVHVTHADPGYRAEYERVFQAPVVFGAARNSLLFEDGWTRHKVGVLPAYARGVLAERAEKLLSALEGGKSTRGRLEVDLERQLAGGDLGMTAAATRLGMGSRTLQRRLAAEGVTFAQVLDQLRSRLARRMLEDRTVADTAWRLGFSDPAAFSRAFKRWTGERPGGRSGR